MRYAHEHVFHYTDYDIIVHGRGRKCSYFLITHDVYFRALVKPRSRSVPATDVCFTQHQAPRGDAALSHIDGAVRSRLQAFVPLGKLPVQATATKHAVQVWLRALSAIDITAQSISNQALQKGERSASPVKG